MLDQQLVAEIDQTLDQLIRNAEAMSRADLQSLSEVEVGAFQKTQESLLHRLLRMDQCMGSKQHLQIKDSRTASARIQEKRARLRALESEYTPQLAEFEEQCTILSKRRKKRFFDPRYSKNSNRAFKK